MKGAMASVYKEKNMTTIILLNKNPPPLLKGRERKGSSRLDIDVEVTDDNLVIPTSSQKSNLHELIYSLLAACGNERFSSQKTKKVLRIHKCGYLACMLPI